MCAESLRIMFELFRKKHPMKPVERSSAKRGAGFQPSVTNSAFIQCPQEEQVKDSGLSPCPLRPPAAGRRKNLEFEPLSTTALILEDRPS